MKSIDALLSVSLEVVFMAKPLKGFYAAVLLENNIILFLV